jgi:hypothetical protein
MKKLWMVLAISVLLLSACKKEKVIDDDDLPRDARDFISTHFSGITISQSVREWDDTRWKYEVYLNNGTKLEFNHKGEIEEISGNSALPDSALPPLLVSYVRTNYPAEYIRKWELESTKQEITLSNNVKLVFDKQGNFLRIDQ